VLNFKDLILRYLFLFFRFCDCPTATKEPLLDQVHVRLVVRNAPNWNVLIDLSISLRSAKLKAIGEGLYDVATYARG
jgi:hypothetical protein